MHDRHIGRKGRGRHCLRAKRTRRHDRPRRSGNQKKFLHCSPSETARSVAEPEPMIG
jgi:hypothetical protein